jgi:hypothetical protein
MVVRDATGTYTFSAIFVKQFGEKGFTVEDERGVIHYVTMDRLVREEKVETSED